MIGDLRPPERGGVGNAMASGFPGFSISALLALALHATSPAGADVLRWTGAGQRGGPDPDAFVLRYDASGALILPEDQGQGEEAAASAEDQADNEEILSVSSAGQGARMAAILPVLRLTTARYAEHAALDLAGLTPRDWALLFQALVRVESAFNPDALSPKGARGLAQLMPDTARALGVEIDDPRENLDGGARYLLAQLETFGSLDLALAAYNAGPDAVRQYGGIPPYAETRAYVARVLTEFERLVAEAEAEAAALSEEGTDL